jgi:nucleotide-binding universal stress UspA family protein
MHMAEFDLKRVLCPVDFSVPSAAALRLAGGMAKTFGAELTVLHAQHLEAPVYFTAAQLQALKAQLRRSLRAARASVADFVAQYLPEDLSRSIEVVEDYPVAAILRTAKSSKAGLVVMGTHGRTGLAKVRLGSVMESVLRQTDVPILTVGPRVKSVASLGAIRRILCPVNYTSLAKSALEYARELAERTGAELILIHIAEQSTQGQGLDEARRALCDWVASDVRERCSVKEVVRPGNSAEQIVAEAKSSGADLVVIGAQPRESLGTMLFGSTTEAVIRGAPCPVFSVVWREHPTKPN